MLVHRSWRLAAAAGGAALALGAAALGVVSAQQTPFASPALSAQGTPGPGGSEGARNQQFTAALAAKLGISTAKLQQAIDQVRQEQGLPAGKSGFGGWHHGGHGGNLTVAAQALKLTPDQLRQELVGKSLIDVAKAHNVDPKMVADALKAGANARIDQAVKSGQLTAAQAAQQKTQEAAEVDQMMTRPTTNKPEANEQHGQGSADID